MANDWFEIPGSKCPQIDGNTAFKVLTRENRKSNKDRKVASKKKIDFTSTRSMISVGVVGLAVVGLAFVFWRQRSNNAFE
jgi:hypothetical protein